MWFGISDGHTKDVFRVVDGSVFGNLALFYPLAFTGCVNDQGVTDCLTQENFICQSRLGRIKPLFSYRVTKSSNQIKIKTPTEMMLPLYRISGHFLVTQKYINDLINR